MFSVFFFFNAPPPTEIYTLSLHDALPICGGVRRTPELLGQLKMGAGERGIQSDRLAILRDRSFAVAAARALAARSEEHTSELQSRQYLVCRLLLEKKKKTSKYLINAFRSI